MVLYSSLIHQNILLLILYMGFVSGISLRISENIFNFLKKHLQKKLENIKNNTFNVKRKTKLYIFQKKLFRFKKNLNVYCFKTLKIFLDVLSPIIFCLGILASYFANLKYNFGQISVFYIMIWGLAFYLGIQFVKIVAKMILSFYNYFIGKVKLKNERPKQ